MQLVKAWALISSLCFLLLGSHPAFAYKRGETRPPLFESTPICLAHPPGEASKKLGWVLDNDSLCGGHYEPKPIQDSPQFKVTADNFALRASGRSTAKGNVVVRSKQREVTANTAHIFRDKGKVTHIELLGNVILNEPDHLMRAKRASFHPKRGDGEVEEVLYRVKNKNQFAWGNACLVKRDTKGNLAFKEVSYSTCPPASHLWEIKARELKLNKASSRGEVKDATFYFFNLPVLYTPYFSFPLDNKRKSGFLMPHMGYQTQNGLNLLLPYYFNLAPNYDFTFLPRYLLLRGMMYGGQFRYLTNLSQGTLEGYFLPNDSAFKQFKLQNLQFAPSLANESNNRYSLKWDNVTHFTDKWQFRAKYQSVSDNYYLQDFVNNLSLASNNQLERLYQLWYTDTHWTFQANVQDYQTLHPFNQPPVLGVYARTPQIMANAEYLALPHHFYFTMLNELDNFRLSELDNATTPEGVRYHLNPLLGVTKETQYGYIRPSIQLYGSVYDLTNTNAANPHQSIFLPVTALDTNFYFAKPLSAHWMQTFEPRLFYLYVPFKNQSSVPVFDTGNYFPSYDLLFRRNRFAGFDRMGDANHLSFGFTSRLMHDGREGFRLSLGSSVLFAKEKVRLCEDFRNLYCLSNPNQLDFFSGDKGLAPIQGEAEVPINEKWSLLGNVAWDTQDNQVTNAMMNVHYEPIYNHIVNFSYGFFSNGDAIDFGNNNDNIVQNLNDLNQFRISYAWPLTVRWRSVGAYSYNISHRFLMTYLFGLQYDTCCVAVRFMAGSAYRFFNPEQGPVYGNNVYLQFLLKGIGSAGTSDPSGVIKTFLPSYRDPFSGGIL